MSKLSRIRGTLKATVTLSDADKRQIADEAQSRRDQPSLTRRMMMADASERAERGEPYNERQGG